MEKLLEEYAEVRARLDDETPSRPFPPASPEAIAAYESSLPAPLPPSYRRFLAKHDGWARFWGAMWLGGAGGEARGWIEGRIALWRRHVGPQHGEGEWFDPEAQIVIGADDNFGFLVFARDASPDGERAVLDMPRGFEENRWDTFEDFIRAQLEFRKRALSRALSDKSGAMIPIASDAKPTVRIKKPVEEKKASGLRPQASGQKKKKKAKPAAKKSKPKTKTKGKTKAKKRR